MTAKSSKGSFGLERIFDQTLEDLIRGLRNNKDNETGYIMQSIDKIKEELSHENIAIKANAVAKMTYLQMLGYDNTCASFNIIEVMSSSKFTHKRIGYLAGSQSFHKGTEVLLLITNTLKKDLRSQSMYESGAAMSSLAHFMTPSLAKYLLDDILALLNSTKPYLRKKAVILMFHLVENHPSAAEDAFQRLKEKLDDSDGGVRLTLVNVICELSHKYPERCLKIVPEFIGQMNCATNNWMLIKLIKLCAVLVPVEPKLECELKQPFTTLIYNTAATSLLYECVNTVVMSMPGNAGLSEMCAEKLKTLIQATDKNLKYLGLLAMSKFLKNHKESVQVHRNLVVSCLEDSDESIRLRAIKLLHEMVSKKTLIIVTKKLLQHLENAKGFNYRDKLIASIIGICSQNNFAVIMDFKWYIGILLQLAEVKGSRNGRLISCQLVDIALRIKSVQKFIVSKMSSLLENVNASVLPYDEGNMRQVLKAAAWICGEYAKYLKNPRGTLECILRIEISSIDTETQSVFVQSAFKMYTQAVYQAEVVDDDIEKAVALGRLLKNKLEIYMVSNDIEVQERSCNLINLVQVVMKRQNGKDKVSEDLISLRGKDLLPEIPGRQKEVAVPKGLYLDVPIIESPKKLDEPIVYHERAEEFHSSEKENSSPHDSGDDLPNKTHKSEIDEDFLIVFD